MRPSLTSVRTRARTLPRSAIALLALAALALLPAGCGGDNGKGNDPRGGSGTPATPGTTATAGTAETPLNLFFVSSTKTPGQLQANSDTLAAAIAEATGLTIKGHVAGDPAVVEAFGAGDAHVAFMGPAGYADAYERGARLKLATLRYGQSTYRSMIISGTGGGIESLSDCNGKSFAYRNTASTSGYIFPMILFERHGIRPGQSRSQGDSHRNVIEQVYSGTADFGAAYWSPPIITRPSVTPDMGFEVDDKGNVTFANGMRVTHDGKVFDGDGNELRDAEVEMGDAREELYDLHDDVYEMVKIVYLTAEIPNDVVVVHSGLADAKVAKVVNALLEHADTIEGRAVLRDMYDITGLQVATDADYEPFRRMLKGH